MKINYLMNIIDFSFIKIILELVGFNLPVCQSVFTSM